MELEVRHLKLVRAVNDAGSLTRAGALLNLTQSALSHQLRHIETSLGTPVFLRVGKRMLLTPAGERLLRSADEVLETIARAEDAIRGLSGADRGVLRLTTQCYTCYHWLPPLLKRYRRAHPNVDVRIDADATLNPVGYLLEGRLDVAVVSDLVRDRRLASRALFHDEAVLIMHPRHPLASRPFIRPQDLAAETLLMYGPKEESTIYRMLVEAGSPPASVQVIQLTEAIIELVKAGLGVACLARWAVAPHLRAGSIRAVSYTSRGYRRTWSAVTLKDMARVPYVRAFVDLLASNPPFQERRLSGGRPS
jgi:LysR family transcriptional regulator, regulator for metE and metH